MLGPVAAALDGDLATRRGSAETDDERLAVDLGTNRRVDGIKIIRETAYGKEYRIRVSDDGLPGHDVYTTTTGAGGTDAVDLAAVDARRVQFEGTAG